MYHPCNDWREGILLADTKLIAPLSSTHYPLQVLDAKLSIPRLSKSLVERSQLLAMLERSVSVPLTVVTAPAGYGKTTTVAQWARSTAHPVAWITLGAEDNAPSRFLSYLITAMMEADPDSFQHVLDNPRMLQELQATVEVVIQAMTLTTRHFCLVLDDFDAIVNRDILRAVTFLINHLPPQAHLIVISRSIPRLPLGRQRARDALQQIEASDLEFSYDESLAFRSASGITEVDEQQWVTLATRTEGWVAGLQLVRLSLRGQETARIDHIVATFEGGVREIDDYLVEEVVSRLRPKLRSFLLRSSILPFLSPELCDYVFETDRSTFLLRDIRERGLFVASHGPKKQWLRYHHLFAEALQRRLVDEIHASEIAAIHTRAATWLADHGALEQALLHAVASQRWDIAIMAIKRMDTSLTMLGRTFSLRSWLDLLPVDVVLADPELRQLLLWGRAITGNFSESAADLALIDRTDPDATYSAREHTMRMQTSYAAGEVDSILGHAEQAIALTPDDFGSVKLHALVFKASALYFLGRHKEAESTFSEVRQITGSESHQWMRNRGEVRYADWLCQRGMLDDAFTLLTQLRANTVLAIHAGDTQVFWFLASLHLERNELDLADEALARALEVAAVTAATQWIPPVHITKAMVEWARGDTAAAQQTAEEAREEAKSLGNLNFAQRAEALQAMMWVATGQQILAERWLSSANLALAWAREFNQPYPALAAIRLFAAQGDLPRALAFLDETIAASKERRRTGDLVRLFAMRAGLLNRLDRTGEAAEALATALDLGAPGGFLRSFLDEGPAIAGLFNHPLIRDHTHRHYAQTVRRSFDAQAVGLSLARQPQLDALSPRELDVLRLVAAGRSNRSIAHELFISEPTVKKHISNIYGKLNVLNRVQAVSLARELGVL